MRRHRPTYINFTLIRLTAVIQTIAGSLVLIASGVILFTLPSFIFWAVFLGGLYLFVPGVIISFGLVDRRTAQDWAKYMLPLWRLIK